MGKSPTVEMAGTGAVRPKSRQFPGKFFKSSLGWILITAWPASCMPAVPGARQASAAQAPCVAEGKKLIRIDCEYAKLPRSTRSDTQWIALNHALISFEAGDENDMEVELTFTRGGKPFLSSRPVYLAIDDDAGRNLIRRLLRNVDLRRLEPNMPLTFSDTLLIGALRPGHYWVHLSIASSDPAAVLDTSQNLLLSNVGVSDQHTGLNNIASFTIH
jgi:hypothetical protein